MVDIFSPLRIDVSYNLLVVDLLLHENYLVTIIFDLYVPKVDREHLENARITRVVVADHTGQAKARYIFASDEIEDRC